jgi:Tol biopolymer transport system component
LVAGWESIVFRSKRDNSLTNSEIYVMNADGSGQTRLTNHLAGECCPGWSPDGTKIAFTSSRDADNGEIYRMDSNGSDVVRLTSNARLRLQPRLATSAWVYIDTFTDSHPLALFWATWIAAGWSTQWMR